MAGLSSSAEGAESTRWIVDANNVVGSRPDGWWRDRRHALLRLLDEITRWRELTCEPVVVVADGHPSASAPEGELYGVEVRYAHSSERDAADDAIVRMIGDEEDPNSFVVVTSDRRLRERSTALGARTEGARRFLSRVADIEPRRADRAVLAHFGIDESALLGRGGEARVFALDDDRVLRLPRRGVSAAALEERRRLLAAVRNPDIVVTPEVLEHREVEGRIVVIERRLPGRSALDVLDEDGTDRRALIRDHLEVAREVAALTCPSDRFGELYGEAARFSTFRDWAVDRAGASLQLGGPAFAGVDATHLTDQLVAALPEPEPATPKLVHLDVFLGNLLAEGDRITALLDFGPMAIGGPPHLDPLVAVAYLAPEITPTATDDDRAVALAWAEEAGLAGAVAPAERWVAAYWAGASEDQSLHRWCRRILLPA